MIVGWIGPAGGPAAAQQGAEAREEIGQGYVIGLIIRQALEKAVSRDPKKIREALAATEFTNLPYPATKVKFGDNGLNIANFALGRAGSSSSRSQRVPQGQALAVVQIDSESVAQANAALDALRKVEAIASARLVELGRS